MGCICPSSKSFSKNGPPAPRAGARRAAGRASGGRARHALLHGRRAPTAWAPCRIEAHMENTVKVFKSVRSQALDLGVQDRDRKPRRRHAGARGEDHHRGSRQGFRGLVPGYRQSDVGGGRPLGHAGNAGALRGDHARARFGGVRDIHAARRDSGWCWATATWIS